MYDKAGLATATARKRNSASRQRLLIEFFMAKQPTETITVRVPRSLKRLAEKGASHDARTLSSLILFRLQSPGAGVGPLGKNGSVIPRPKEKAR